MSPWFRSGGDSQPGARLSQPVPVRRSQHGESRRNGPQSPRLMVSRLRLCGSPHLRLEGGDPLRALRPIVLAGRQRQHHVRRHRDLRGHQRVGLLERHRHRRRRDRTTIARTRVGRGPHAPALMVLSDLRRQRPPTRFRISAATATSWPAFIQLVQQKLSGNTGTQEVDIMAAMMIRNDLHGSHLVLRSPARTHRAHTPIRPTCSSRQACH